MFQNYHTIFNELPKPFAFVDWDALVENFHQLKKRSGSKEIRIATKSVRCRSVLERLKNDFGINRWMCFTMDEACFLADQGFDDLLVAYPSIQNFHFKHLAEHIRNGKTIYLTADSDYQLKQLNQLAEEEQIILPISMDIDVSLDILGIHFGVYRSSLTDLQKVESFIKNFKKYKHLRLAGAMAYDAQIAGVADALDGNFKNPILKLLKKKSLPQIAKKIEDIGKLLIQNDIKLDFFNAGGTGSLEYVSQISTVSEVTFGSGLYHSTLFDFYTNFKGKASTGFVVEVCRNPQNQIFTALGGGYIASGSVGKEKQPTMIFPEGGKLTANEGCGEVQTPFVAPNDYNLTKTNFAIFRPSKAGEYLERFDKVYLLSKGEILDKVPTYRGEGKTFL